MASRLSRAVLPRKYRLTLDPDLSSFTFRGWLEIDLDVREATSVIQFHAVDLDLDVVKLVRIGTDGHHHDVIIQNKENDTTAGITTLRLNDNGGSNNNDHHHALHAHSTAMLRFEYRGTLNDLLAGFYRSRYTVEGEDRYMAVTQFEACDARRCFPCWDQPSFKAVFEVNVKAPAGRIVISNMPVKSMDTHQDGSSMYHFEDTPIMSTYLVCVCVGEYDYIETTNKEGVLVRVYTTPGKKEQGRVALDAAAASLSMFHHWFDVPYPLKKLDLLAIPDFSAGAMENWGAVTFRETALLAVPGQSSEAYIHNVCRIVAHELAHQWFGNLVTMEWWTHLWLNEGFARWAETLCVDHIHPEWNFWQKYVGNAYTQALNLDSLKSSHAIEVAVKSEKEINQIFDAISYAKGASVIRMLAAFLGIETFQKGLHYYLTTHQFQNTVTEDLWASLRTMQMGASVDVETMMTSWTKQVGYPVVRVEEITPQNVPGSTTRTFRLTQTRFLRTGVNFDDHAQRWMIPLTISSQKSAHPTKVLMSEDNMTVTIEAGPTDWVYFNSRQTGVYRVYYATPRLVTAIGAGVANKQLLAEDRLGFEFDLYALVLAGVIPTTQLLNIYQYYRDEDDQFVWGSIISHLQALSHVFSEEDWFASFDSFACDLLMPVAKRLGWESRNDDRPNDATLRAQAISFLGELSHPDITAEGIRRFHADALAPDLRATTYGIVVACGQKQQYNAMLSKYESAEFVEEKKRALSALGRTTDPELVQHALHLALSPKVRSQDISALIDSLASSSPASRRAVWQWAKDNWSTIDSRLSSSLFVFGSLVTACITHFTDSATADDIEQFFIAHPCPAADRNIAQALERVRAAAAWRSRDSQEVRSWYKKPTVTVQASTPATIAPAPGAVEPTPVAKVATPSPNTTSTPTPIPTSNTSTTPTKVVTPTPAPSYARSSTPAASLASTKTNSDESSYSNIMIGAGVVLAIALAVYAWRRS